jgi:hypothetical protein
MRPEQRDRMNELCRSIQTEQNPRRLTELAEELNRLLLLAEKETANVAQPTSRDEQTG